MHFIKLLLHKFCVFLSKLKHLSPFIIIKFFSYFRSKNITAVCCAAYRFVCFGTVIVKACAGLAVAYVFKFVYEKLCFLRGDFSVK